MFVVTDSLRADTSALVNFSGSISITSDQIPRGVLSCLALLHPLLLRHSHCHRAIDTNCFAFNQNNAREIELLPNVGQLPFEGHESRGTLA